MAKKAKASKKVVNQFDKVLANVKTGTKEVRGVAQEVNEFTLKTTDEVLDVAIASGEKWQAVSQKAIKGGLKLASKNNDILFDFLGDAKKQMLSNTKRVKGLFSIAK